MLIFLKYSFVFILGIIYIFILNYNNFIFNFKDRVFFYKKI